VTVFDAIVVGSGAAGTWAAWALRGTRTLVLDVGHRPSATSLEGNLYDLRKQRPLFEEMIGPRYESLNDLENPKLSPRVKSPLQRHVIERPATAPAIRSRTFEALVSYAEGGLANAWGAHVYRFFKDDLTDFPVAEQDLAPYYDTLTREIGISGAADDLTRFHGPATGLLPPLELSAIGTQVMQRYAASAARFHRAGVFLGRPRLAVLSIDRDDRTACAYENLEFFKPRIPAIYTPAFTLRSMVARREIEYAPGHLVERFQERDDAVEVYARDDRGNGATFRARRLILCLGALNTARLVLASGDDRDTRLPILENPCSFTPLVMVGRIGMPLEKRSFYAQVNLFYAGPLSTEPLVGMIYGVDGLLRSDMLFQFPLAARGCLTGARYVLPAMAVLQVFYPDDPDPANTLRLDANGDLVIDYEPRALGAVERHLIRVLKTAGLRSSPRLIRAGWPGASVHYAGSLPMRERPARKYETDPLGRLAGHRRVHVGDSATFPRLPAKNLTFTIMANAMRIGEHVKQELAAAGA
jgi:choline dehydrogenase-like flavoprotein